MCGLSEPPRFSARVASTANGPTPVVDTGSGTESRQGRGTHPDLPDDGCRALVDTGTSASSIDDDLASNRDLPVMDRSAAEGAGGTRPAAIHLARALVPGLGLPAFGDFAGAKLSRGTQRPNNLEHRVLPGRAFPGHLRMCRDGRKGAATTSKPRQP